MSFAAVDPLAALTAIVYLAIAIVAARRSSDVPLARPLAVFAIGLFAYIFFEQGTPPRAPGGANAIENAIASLVFVPAVELIFAFTGRRRAFRWIRLAALAFYVPLAAYCFAPFFRQELWEMGMLVGLLFFFGVPGVALVHHYRRGNAAERSRTLLLLGALLLGGVGAASTLLIAYGAPRLLDVGMIAAGVLLAALVLDPELVRGSSRMTALTAGAFAAVVVSGEIVLFSLREQTGALFVAGTVALVLLSFAIMRPLFAAAATQRSRVQHLATLGCLAEQMEHDLLNPLTAISANVQYLKEERRRGRSIDDSDECLDRVLEQADRVARIVRDYRRLSRVEPRRETVALAPLIESVVEGQCRALGEVDVSAGIPTDLTDQKAHLDPDLVETALENLVRNAFQAITESGEGSTIRVSVAKCGGHLALRVADDGPGMDPRTIEQARDHYFTTRDAGTGLGLSYASRVAEAHGGELRIESQQGGGTTVTLLLPAAAPARSAAAAPGSLLTLHD